MRVSWRSRPRPSDGRPELNRRREAGVEIDDLDIVDADAGQLQGGPAAGPDGGRLGQGPAIRHVRVLVAVGAGVREHPAVLGHAERPGLVDRAHDERRGLVDIVVGVHVLRVGEPDHPVLRGGRADLLRRPGLPGPGVGVRGGDLREPRPQLADPPLVLVDRLAGAVVRSGPQRGLDHRVHLDRHHDAAGQLLGRAHRQLRADRPPGLGALGQLRPRQGLTRPPGPRPGAPSLGPGQDGQVQLATLDLARGDVDQHLGAVAALRGQDGLPCRDPQAFGHEVRGVPVAP